MALNPPTARGVMVASTPPVMMASASPRWIIFQASPMLWFPVAQAVTTELLGPLAPKRMEICPGASFTISMGMKKGEIRPGPFSSRTLWKDSMVVNPPRPAPTTTPTRSAFCGRYFELGIFHGHDGRGHGILDKNIHAPGSLFYP